MIRSRWCHPAIRGVPGGRDHPVPLAAHRQVPADVFVGEGVGVVIVKPLLGLVVLSRDVVLKKLDENLVKLPRTMHRAMDMPGAQFVQKGSGVGQLLIGHVDGRRRNRWSRRRYGTGRE